MKTKLTALLVLIALAMGAQTYNKTYDINGNSDFLSPSFVIGLSDLGTAAVSWANDGGSPQLDYFIVTKHDAAGTTLWNNRFYPVNSTDGFTHVKAMIETKDRGILIAGYYYKDNSSHEAQPFLIKVDYYGTFQWQRWYPVNSTYFDGYQTNKISLARVEDESKECYFIVSCADSDANPGRDQVVNVIKVDNGGGLIWTKKYFDTNNQSYNFWNIPGDIAYSKDDGMYMITGYRLELGLSKEPRVFFFGIDKDGTVLTYFKTLNVPGIPTNQDMIYDPNTKYFAVALTHDGLDPSYYNYTYSAIGLITIDAGLNVNIHNLYWHYAAKENRGYSISLNTDKDYVIGCDTYDGSYGVRNPSILKTDNSGSPLLIMKYNIYDDVMFGHHCNSFDPITGDMQYVLVTEHKNNLRVLRTTINAKTCGARDYDPIVKQYDFREELFKYKPREIGDIERYEPKVKELRPEERKCTDLTYDSYRTMNTTGITGKDAAQSGLLIYPTEVTLTSPVVSFENNTGASINLQVIDLNGKVVMSQPNMSAGKNSLNLGSGNLSEGIYLVKYYNSTGSVSGSKKVIISK